MAATEGAGVCEDAGATKVGSFAAAVDAEGDKFFFGDGYVKTNLGKWDVARGLRYHKFRYDKFYHKQNAEDFARDFFASEDVRREILAPGGLTRGAPRFEVRPLRASQTSMAFFDKLAEEPRLVRANGTLVKCMDDYHQGFHVQVRFVLLTTHPPHYTITITTHTHTHTLSKFDQESFRRSC